jgi:hypothetical protein
LNVGINCSDLVFTMQLHSETLNFSGKRTKSGAFYGEKGIFSGEFFVEYLTLDVFAM